MMKMQVKGYSERGVVNALFYEIRYHHDSLGILSDLLSQASFPFVRPLDLNVAGAQLLIEQSLSDFGDADAIGLIETPTGKFTIFFEAKVKPSQRSSWSLEEEWRKFEAGSSERLSSSNLFTQLYHKARFFDALCSDGNKSLSEGVHFPACSSKSIRKIGNNEVVLKAVNLISQYAPSAYFLAVVPDSPEPVAGFFTEKLKNSSPADFSGWDVSRWGYLCWSTVADFCSRVGLNNTLEVLEFNKGQVY